MALIAQIMAKKMVARQPFNIMIVGQSGRLQYESLLFAASLRHTTPDFSGKLFVATPDPGPMWARNPSIRNSDVLDALARLEVDVLRFPSRCFGDAYPQGNKIEALLAMPEQEPFIFFDSDTLVTGDLLAVPFDFDRPSASLKCEGTWPKPTLYGPGYGAIWKSLYDRFGLDFDAILDKSQPEEHWRRYPYYNAGYFHGACPHQFGRLYQDYALSIRDDPPPALVDQRLFPWLDQIALPLVIHALGGGRDALPSGWIDGETTCHYRLFPLLYARESDAVVDLLETVSAPNWIKKVLKQHDPIKRMVYQGRGAKVRAMFDQNALPRREQALRNQIKAAGFWMR